MLSKDLLKLSSILSVPPGSLLFTWSRLGRSTIRPQSGFPRRNDVEEIFVSSQFSVLVDNCHCGLEVPTVQRVDDGPHDVQSLSLWDEILLDGTCSLAFLLVELPLLVLDLEVSGFHEVPVLLAAGLRDVAFRIFLQLDLDLIEDTHQEGFLALVRLSALRAEDLEDFTSEEPPLRSVLRELEFLEHVLKVFVADPLVLILILDLDLVLDQA